MRVVLVWILTCLIWGTIWLFIKVGLGDLPPFSFAGLLLGVNYALLYWGARYIPSGLTAVLQAVTPAFGLVFARRFLPGERATPRGLAALAVGVAGVVVIFSDQ